MKKIYKLIDVFLNLFDGGASGAAGAGSGGGASGTGAASATGNVGAKGDTNAQYGADNSDGNTRRQTSGEANTKQASGGASLSRSAVSDPDAGGGEKKSLEERRKAYRALMEGEYKDLYTEDTQGLINRRFKETKQMQETITKQRGVLDVLAQKFGIEDGDIDKISEALSKDDDFWAMAADRAGMEIDTFKEFTRLKAQERAFEREKQARADAEAKVETDRRVRETMEGWQREAESMKATYPEFDLERETSNKEFMDSLTFYQRAQVQNPVERAYKATHHDELLSAAVGKAKAETEKGVVDNIRAKGARPAENGTQSRSAFTGKVNVHNLNKAQRAELARRAERGEIIDFSSLT